MQHTRQSELARRVRIKLAELEKVGKIKVKIVERSGTKLEELVHKSNVWDRKDCMREDCWVCDTGNLGGKKGQCYKKNITYETYCITCYKQKEKERKERMESGIGAVPSSQQGEIGVVKEIWMGEKEEEEEIGIGAEPSLSLIHI